jgi:hypothetical protein
VPLGRRHDGAGEMGVLQRPAGELTDEDATRILDGYTRMPADGGSSMLYDRLAGRPPCPLAAPASARIARLSGTAIPCRSAAATTAPVRWA